MERSERFKLERSKMFQVLLTENPEVPKPKVTHLEKKGKERSREK